MNETKTYRDTHEGYLHSLKTRPSMYLGEPSLDRLICFIAGCEASEMINHSQKRFFDTAGFAQWYSEKTGRRNHFEDALAQAGSDGEAFHVWFDWYFEYLDAVEKSKSS